MSLEQQRSTGASSKNYSFSLEQIKEILPHRPPFLFVDRVIKLIPDNSITTERVLHPEEPQFTGHFPEHPIMPGVLITDALAQTAGLLWGLSKKIREGADSTDPQIFYLASVNIKYTHPSYPGDTLIMTAYPEKVFGAFHSFTVEATVGRNVIAKGSLTLAITDADVT